LYFCFESKGKLSSMIKKTIELNFRVLQNSNDTFFAIANSIGRYA